MFDGKKILITGASSGIGAETARVLAREGAEVFLMARREDKLLEVAQSFGGGNPNICVFDLKNVNEIEKVVDSIVISNGPLDGLVHCAGVGVARPLKMMHYDFMKDVMDLNYFSFIELVRVFMKKKNHNANSSIVAISAASAYRANPAGAAYASSKSALDTAIKNLALELAPKKVRINSVIPGWIDTDIGRQQLDREGIVKEEEIDAYIMKKQCLGVGYPIDVANAIEFLLSDKARLITGTNLIVDGGFLL